MTPHYSAEDCERDEAFPPKGACGCRVIVTPPAKDKVYVLNTDYAPGLCEIHYCKLHQAARQMREALELALPYVQHTELLTNKATEQQNEHLAIMEAALTASQEGEKKP